MFLTTADPPPPSIPRRLEMRAKLKLNRLNAVKKTHSHKHSEKRPVVCLSPRADEKLRSFREQLEASGIPLAQLYEFMDRDKGHSISFNEFANGIKYTKMNLSPKARCGCVGNWDLGIGNHTAVSVALWYRRMTPVCSNIPHVFVLKSSPNPQIPKSEGKACRFGRLMPYCLRALPRAQDTKELFTLFDINKDNALNWSEMKHMLRGNTIHIDEPGPEYLRAAKKSANPDTPGSDSGAEDEGGATEGDGKGGAAG